jgi:hypothetical protein
MKKLLTTAAILICFIANSQCIKGDCDDGVGKKRYERPVKGTYEGQFKDRLPEGKGKFIYDFGVEYDGYFTIGDIDSTKVGEVVYDNGNEKKGFITEMVDNKYKWELNGKGEQKLALKKGGFRIEKGNFFEDGFYNLKQADKIKLFDSFGRKVTERNLNQELVTLNIKNLRSGLYFYELSNNNQTISNGKIIFE